MENNNLIAKLIGKISMWPFKNSSSSVSQRPFLEVLEEYIGQASGGKVLYGIEKAVVLAELTQGSYRTRILCDLICDNKFSLDDIEIELDNFKADLLKGYFLDCAFVTRKTHFKIMEKIFNGLCNKTEPIKWLSKSADLKELYELKDAIKKARNTNGTK